MWVDHMGCDVQDVGFIDKVQGTGSDNKWWKKMTILGFRVFKFKHSAALKTTVTFSLSADTKTKFLLPFTGFEFFLHDIGFKD